MFAIAVGIGVACGALNAIFIPRLRISSIIVSIATLNIFYGLLIFFTGGKYITSLPNYSATGSGGSNIDDASDTSYGVNLQILVLALAFLVAWLLLNRTNIGRQIYAIGGNKDAAQRLGFHVFGLNFLVYGYLGFIAGIASLVQAQLAQSVTPTVLVGKELDVFAAVVLGGASLTGGVGTVFGTILASGAARHPAERLRSAGRLLLLVAMVRRLIILVAVSTTAWSQRRRRTRSARAMSDAARPLPSPTHPPSGRRGDDRHPVAVPGRALVGFRLAPRRSAVHRRHAAVDGLPAAGTRHPFAGDDGGVASGGLNLSIIATANLCALTMACVLTRYMPGTQGVAGSAGRCWRCGRLCRRGQWSASSTDSSSPISAFRRSSQRSAR